MEITKIKCPKCKHEWIARTQQEKKIKRCTRCQHTFTNHEVKVEIWVLIILKKGKKGDD